MNYLSSEYISERLVWIITQERVFLKLMWKPDLLSDGTCYVDGKLVRWAPFS